MAKLHIIDTKIIQILINNQEGLTADEIIKTLNLKRRTAYNHLSKLKEESILEHINPFWRCAKEYTKSGKMAQLMAQSKNIQAHKFSFVLQLMKVPIWWEKRNID